MKNATFTRFSYSLMGFNTGSFCPPWSGFSSEVFIACEVGSFGVSLLISGQLAPWYIRKGTCSKRCYSNTAGSKQSYCFTIAHAASPPKEKFDCPVTSLRADKGVYPFSGVIMRFLQAQTTEAHLTAEVEKLRDQFNARKGSASDHAKQLELLKEEVFMCTVGHIC